MLEVHLWSDPAELCLGSFAMDLSWEKGLMDWKLGALTGRNWWLAVEILEWNSFSRKGLTGDFVALRLQVEQCFSAKFPK